jgi:hypothetical protein
MNPVDALPRTRKPAHLFRKLVLLVLLIAAYALGLVLLHLKTPWFPALLYVIFANCALAVVSGFGVRLLLSQRGWFIRSLVAAILPLAGLALLGYFTDWEFGIDVIALSLGYVSWVDLAQLVTGVLASWAALWAWHRPARREAAHAAVAALPRSPEVVQPRRARLPHNRPTLPRLRVSTRSGAQPGSDRGPVARARTRLLPGRAAPSVARIRTRFRRPHVQLALVEEHRCPYCLEPVSRSDPRGVKECEICHALHHADCWEITGTCQVPHLNA